MFRLGRQRAGNMKSYRDGVYFHGIQLWAFRALSQPY